MRKHTETSLFPSIRLGGEPIPRLILGHLPFVGESYQGFERNKEYSERFSNIKNTIKILERAVKNHGVTVVANSPVIGGGLPALLMNAIKKTNKLTSLEITLVSCFMIPLRVDNKPLDVYRRWVTYYECERKTVDKEELLRKYLEDPILQCRKDWKEKFQRALTQIRPYDAHDIKKLEIDYKQLNEEVLSLKDFTILLAEVGSETDFLTLIGRLDLLEEFSDALRTKLRCPIILGTHHAGSTIPILEDSAIKFDGYITPVNKLGVMMLPTQKLACKAMRGRKKPLIAIKPLAGGRINPMDAFEYVYKEQGADACMVGVASEDEVDEDLQAAKLVLEGEEAFEASF